MTGDNRVNDDRLTSLVLIRHGATSWNLEDRYQSRTDLPSDNKLIDPICFPVGLIERFSPSKVLCSPALRARSTMLLLDEHMDHPTWAVRYDSLVRELDFGFFEGLTKAEIDSGPLSDAYGRWQEGLDKAGPPGGETWPDVRARARRLLGDLIQARMTSVVISHSYFIRVLILEAAGLPPTKLGFLRIDNLSVTVLSHDWKGWQIEALNVLGSCRHHEYRAMGPMPNPTDHGSRLT